MPENTKSLIDQITAVVHSCGQVMLNATCDDSMIDAKEGKGNFVTIYDKKIQSMLQEQLLAILPDAVFIGEEDEGDHASLKNGYAFIVDPIDGTANFAKNCRSSCISVGLVKNSEPYIGVVYNPYLEEMYTAQKDQGAWLNGTPIHVSDKPLSEGLFLFGTSPYYEELHQPAFQIGYHYFKRAMDLRRGGSAAIDICAVAAGRCELFFELRLFPWDFAASALICQEAGGKVTTIDGKPFCLDKPCSIIASNSIADTSLPDELLNECKNVLF